MPRVKEQNSNRSYFKEVYTKNPGWLKSKSNEEIYAQWLADHPGKELTASIKSGISNIKSELRNNRRRRSSASRHSNGSSSDRYAFPRRRVGRPRGSLNNLEIMIDEAILLAHKMDSRGLSKVIDNLRVARNKVILALGATH